MTEKRRLINLSIVLGITVVLMLFFFILVAHHHDIVDRVQKHRGALLGTGLSVAEWTGPGYLIPQLAHGDHLVDAFSAGVPIAPARAAVPA